MKSGDKNSAAAAKSLRLKAAKALRINAIFSWEAVLLASTTGLRVDN
jgi:hypothetical protein